ncbi:MAG: DUF6516 family protein [Thermodesulfobacteriota bacterium]
MIESYLDRLRTVLDRYIATPLVLHVKLDFETRPGGQCHLSGEVLFKDGSTLHFREFLDTTPQGIERLMYSYHHQDADKHMVFRYDNARHRPLLATLAHHKHVPEGIKVVPCPTFEEVLEEAVTLSDLM